MKNTYKIFLGLATLILLSVSGYLGFQHSNNNVVTEQSIFSSSGDSLTELQKNIVKKFREGNIPGLSEYFGEEVSITLFKENDYYTKEEAKDVLLGFCQGHTHRKFLVKHYGSNKSKTSFYLIGELTTTGDEKYRVYVSNSETELETIEITMPKEDPVR